MKTVEEAKACVCPTMSRQFTTGYMEHCIAGECMMWRWEQIKKHPAFPRGQTSHSFDPNQSPLVNGTKGYCGLAGNE